MSQHIPDKPDWMSDDEWRYFLKRNDYRCALYDKCIGDGKSGYCSHELHVDHRQPQVLGGDDSFVNARLLCASKNVSRPDEPLKMWAESNHWDEPIEPDGLREIQRCTGYDEILRPEIARAFNQREYRNLLLRLTILLVAATGTGKSVSIQAVFHAINQVVNAHGPGRPRIKRVLILVPQEGLRDLLVHELRDDAFKFGIAQNRPRVRAIRSYQDFLKGHDGFDICVACPQSLWTGDKRTIDDVRDALRDFDTIVFDECDWANDRVRSICKTATHALKFAITASPPVMPGTPDKVANAFASHFVLISEGAIGDYERAQPDKCLKHIDPNVPFHVSALHSAHDDHMANAVRTISGEVRWEDLAVPIACIKEMAGELRKLESDMRSLHPEIAYSPQFMVRIERLPIFRFSSRCYRKHCGR